MSQHYSNPARANDPHALPDVEVFAEHVLTCSRCGTEWPDGEHLSARCPDCGGDRLPQVEQAKPKWWWVSCFPGCLPDGDVYGPFETEQEAIDDAQSGLDEEPEVELTPPTGHDATAAELAGFPHDILPRIGDILFPLTIVLTDDDDQTTTHVVESARELLGLYAESLDGFVKSVHVTSGGQTERVL